MSISQKDLSKFKKESSNLLQWGKLMAENKFLTAEDWELIIRALQASLSEIGSVFVQISYIMSIVFFVPLCYNVRVNRKIVPAQKLAKGVALMKKEYKAPVVVAAECVMASSGACGQSYRAGCGELVQMD